MWVTVFFLCLPIALYKALKDPVWAPAVAAYLYFAIPIVEYYAPAAPYQAFFWGLSVLTCWRLRAQQRSAIRDELQFAALEVVRQVVATIRAPMKNALFAATQRGGLASEVRAAALGAAEPPALEIVEAKTPAPIAVPVRRSVLSAIAATCDAGEKEALAVARIAGLKATRGNVRASLEARAGKAMDETLDRVAFEGVSDAIDGAIDEHERLTRSESPKRRRRIGPLGAPMGRGAFGTILTNTGVWLHLVFVILSYIGASHAQHNRILAEDRAELAVLLYIPIIGILATVRSVRAWRIFIWAWMLGVFQLSMNGLSVWLRYGGRAENVGGQGGESNFLGAIVVAVAPIAFAMITGEKHRVLRLLGLFAGGGYALAIIASGSRGALIAFVVALAYWLFHTNKKGIASGICLVGFAGFLIAAPESFWLRMSTMLFSVEQNPWIIRSVEPSAHERMVLWDLAIQLWKENPWLGIGPQQFIYESAERTTIVDAYMGARGMMAHNSWLQIAAEYGTVGLVFWAAGIVTSLFWIRRARKLMAKYPGWQSFTSTCLGLEAGVLSTMVVITFASFQWFDYLYWIIVFGPLTYQIAAETAERLEWYRPEVRATPRPPARYAAPKTDRLALEGIDLHRMPVVRPASR